jgi:hypothetical protein
VLKDDHFVAIYSKFQNRNYHIVSLNSSKIEKGCLNSYGHMPLGLSQKIERKNIDYYNFHCFANL